MNDEKCKQENSMPFTEEIKEIGLRINNLISGISTISNNIEEYLIEPPLPKEDSCFAIGNSNLSFFQIHINDLCVFENRLIKIEKTLLNIQNQTF